MRSSRGPSIAACLLAAAVAGCAASPAKRAARAGDYRALKAILSGEVARGTLDRGRVRELAEAVGTHEILDSRPPALLAPIEDAQLCAHHLADALETRARSDDEAAAMSMLVLLDGRAGGWRTPDRQTLLRNYRSSPAPLFRAVAARAAVGPDFGTDRRGFFADPDERVRLGALRAALEIADPADREPLTESARLDPNPLGQSLAIRALGGIGGPRTVLALRDRWATADEGLRQSIVDAWKSPRARDDGGLREIVAVAESDRGSPAIEAGLALLAVKSDDRQKAAGLRAVLSGIDEGIERDRAFAISSAPLDQPLLRDAVDRACAKGPANLRISACIRLTDAEATKKKAISSLREIADQGSDPALFALARAGDRAAGAKLLPLLISPDRRTRIDAARVLIDLGELGRAAQLLADPDLHVRMTVACGLLLSTRPKP
jgi:HEAT repeat protein